MTLEHLDLVAIVYIGSNEIQRKVRVGLNQIGFRDVRFPGERQLCLSHLHNLPEALLIAEWTGIETIKILEASRDQQLVDPRRIYLIVNQFQDGFLQIITDYHINGVFAGNIESQDIHRDILHILDKNHPVNAFKNEFQRLLSLKHQNKMAQAQTQLEKMIDKSPNNNKLRLELAALLIEMNEWKSAETTIDIVLLKELGLPRALHLKARCLLQRKKLVNASEYLRLATNLNPFHADRLIEFGETLLQINNPKDALKSFQKAQEIQPEDERIVKGLQQATLLLDDYSEILKLMAQLTSERERASVFNNAAVICAANRDFAKAIKLYSMGISVIQGHHLKAKMAFNKSLSFAKSGDKVQAIDQCAEAIKWDPSYKKAQKLLQKLEAIQHIPESLDIESEIEEVKEDIYDFSNLDEAL